MISRQVFIQVLGPLQHGRRPIRCVVEGKVVVTEGVTLSLPATLQPLAIGAGHTQVLEFELGVAKVEVAGSKLQLDVCDLRGFSASDFGAGWSGPRTWYCSARSLFFPVFL